MGNICAGSGCRADNSYSPVNSQIGELTWGELAAKGMTKAERHTIKKAFKSYYAKLIIKKSKVINGKSM